MINNQGYEPFNFRIKHTDADSTDYSIKYKPIEYPKPDGVLTFDILENLSRRYNCN